MRKVVGFTLIELMIVVAIIGILASIALPQYKTYTEKAANSACLAEAKGVMVGVVVAVTNNNQALLPAIANKACAESYPIVLPTADAELSYSPIKGDGKSVVCLIATGNCEVK